MLERNTSYILIFCMVVALAGFFWKDLVFGSPPEDRIAFRIITEYHGANAAEIERIITIPLENSLGDVPGITRIQSMSEFGRSRITLSTGTKYEESLLYADIRERVERTRAFFPTAVQKPRIVTSGTGKNPVFIVSFQPGMSALAAFGNFVDREIKPRFQRVPGTGDIETGGKGIQETRILLDNDKAARYGIDNRILSSRLRGAMIRAPVGEFSSRTFTIPVVFTNQYTTPNDFRNLVVPGQGGAPVRISETASVVQRYRTPEQTSRINGEKRITVYIHTGGTTNPLILCRNLERTCAELEKEGFSPHVIYSKGRDLEKGIRGICRSMGISMATIFIFVYLFIPGMAARTTFILSLPVSLFFGVAVLSAATVPIDTGVLSGLIIGSGMILDNYLVVYNHIQTQRIVSLKPVAGPIVSATATTIIAFFPLLFGTSFSPQTRSIAFSLSALLLVSLVVSCTFLKKPFIHSRIQKNSSQQGIPLSTIARPFFRLLGFSRKKPGAVCMMYALLVTASITILVFADKEFSPQENPGILFTHVEFPGGTPARETDRHILPFIHAAAALDMVDIVESSARRGSAQINCTFNPEKIRPSVLADTLKTLSSVSPNGQFFVGTDQNLDSYQIPITLTGPDHGTLRKTVRRIAHEFSTSTWVREIVFHFKEAPPGYVFSPNPEQIFRLGEYPELFAHSLQWVLQKPVAIKWLYKGAEQDVRLSGCRGISDLSAIKQIPVVLSSNTTVRIGDAGTVSPARDPDKLYRENRQNAISFSVITNRIALTKLAAKLREQCSGTTVPTGYGLLIDPQINTTIQNYRQLYCVLCIAVLLIYALLAIQTESFSKPIIIISAIPFSAFPPLVLLLIAKQAVTPSIMIALTVLSGMAVNNYILVLDGVEKNTSAISLTEKINTAIENRFLPLFLSSGTTILAAIPILFSSSLFSSAANTLAVIVSLGIAGSFAGSFFFLPALLVKTRR